MKRICSFLPSAHCLLAALLLLSFALKLINLNHAAIHAPDEIITATVSQNILKHPLVPTLVDPPYLKPDESDWTSSYLWVFKPPVAFWQVALSFKLLGITPFALRLPSVIGSTIAAWMTFLIARRWFSEPAGVIAAALQAFNPAIFALVHGYQFSDHIDISLLMWSEISVYFLARAMETAERFAWFACAFAFGLALLSKWHLALFIPGLICVALALPALRLIERPTNPIRIKHLLYFALGAIVSAAPWLIYIELKYPGLLLRTNRFVLAHLHEDMSTSAAPWDRLLFDFNIKIFYLYYPLLLAATAWALIRAVQQKRVGLWLALAWLVGTYLPNVLAQTKTPSSTLIGWPAGWLLVGHLIAEAWRGDRLATGIWVAATLPAALLVSKAQIPGQTWGYGPYPGAIFIENQYVLWQALLALLCGAILAHYVIRSRNHAYFISVALGSALLLTGRFWGDAKKPSSGPRGYLVLFWKSTQIKADQPDFRALGRFGHSLPANAALIVDEQTRSEARLVQFAADRVGYALGKNDWHVMSDQLRAAGAQPYLVSTHTFPLPMLYTDSATGRMIYNAGSPTSPPDTLAPTSAP